VFVAVDYRHFWQRCPYGFSDQDFFRSETKIKNAENFLPLILGGFQKLPALQGQKKITPPVCEFEIL